VDIWYKKFYHQKTHIMAKKATFTETKGTTPKAKEPKLKTEPKAPVIEKAPEAPVETPVVTGE
jgi:hypothetical protein